MSALSLPWPMLASVMTTVLSVMSAASVKSGPLMATLPATPRPTAAAPNRALFRVELNTSTTTTIPMHITTVKTTECHMDLGMPENPGLPTFKFVSLSTHF